VQSRGGTRVNTEGIEGLRKRRASEYHVDDVSAAELVDAEAERVLGLVGSGTKEGETEGLGVGNTGENTGHTGAVGEGVAGVGGPSVSDRLPPFLRQDVPLWTVLAGVVGTYVVTRVFGV
jgi:hypothetical protein